MDARFIEGLIGSNRPGVVCGFEAPDPGSGLSYPYTDGIIRLRDTAKPDGYTEYKVAGATLTITASKDTYVYVTPAGVVAVIEKANGGTKPTQADIGGVAAQFLFKVVSDGSDITSVQDLRQFAGVKIRCLHVPFSFEATEVGDADITPGFRGRVLALDGTVANALAGTDAGTVDIKHVSAEGPVTTLTGGQLSFAASAAAGVRDFEVPSLDGGFSPFDRLRLTSAKATAGGYGMATIWCEERF